MTEAIPAEVRDLLVRHLATMEHVEVLLTLLGDEARAWSPDDIAPAVHSTPASVGTRLVELSAAGLATRSADGGSYRYAPRTPELRRAVDSLENMYRTRPVTLIKAIYERPVSAAQSFADAFRVRKADP